ncbi:EamA family transporter [Pseudooceanicola sp. 216_PA32_1]|uniref:EamA family transporter n=1 Tax=Pseudooceanicola pacificus TaxID=2676438 RepID=A0A844WC23_9RHOB|nr:DMT family transporter [Pseudooceanicola pacificus]MWB78833.1 EamA family transporter [Pseudooceanicola pacificus]
MSGTSRADVLSAVVWMSGAVGSFIAMAVAARAVSFELDTFEIMTYRSAVGVLIVVVVLTLRGRWHVVRVRKMPLHFARNLAHFTGQNLWLLAVMTIPLAQVFALEFSAPIWVVVLSPLMLGERMTVMRWLAALLGFAGVLMVARPGAQEISPGLLAAAAAAICFALNYVITKRLTRTEATGSILFWLTTLQLGMGLICAGFDGDIALPSPASLPWLMLIGCAGLLAHYCLTTALTFAPATVVMPIDFARLPLIAVVGALFYAEPLDIWVLAGALVIFGGNYLNIWSETRA